MSQNYTLSPQIFEQYPDLWYAFYDVSEILEEYILKSYGDFCFFF